ncbi:hypothetical protein [Tepidibacillus marianensis]|uniref:hypothetical protein n=1 Tax=Tepidibacillus marianensis TaxID=3131995 RepID=UPI0030D5F7D0
MVLIKPRNTVKNADLVAEIIPIKLSMSNFPFSRETASKTNKLFKIVLKNGTNIIEIKKDVEKIIFLSVITGKKWWKSSDERNTEIANMLVLNNFLYQISLW